MMFKLKKFQKEAVNDLLIKVNKLIDDQKATGSILRFQAPTGSGKTIILSFFIEEFFQSKSFNENKKQFAFIWLTPGKGGLHIQSQNKINEVLYHSETKIFSFEDVLKKPGFPNKSVTVLNWEKIAKKDNRYLRKNERFNLKDFLNYTKNIANVTLIAIVDEEHYAQTQKTSNVLDFFEPKVVIRTSATPKKNQNYQELVKILREDVIKAELIKKKYILNYRFEYSWKKAIVDSQLGENQFLIQQALETQKELLNAYIKNESEVNPLIIIQLPDEKGDYQRKIRENTVQFLFKSGVTYDNKLLAIDLDKYKVNLEGLKKLNSKTICIITKQTITHGWDCPRAQILVKLRGNSAKTFNIQTLGRISRVPEVKIGHYYDEEKLNNGYVFTLDKSLSLIKDDEEGEKNHLIKNNFPVQIKDQWKQECSTTPIPNQLQHTSKQDGSLVFARKFNEWFRKSQGLNNIPADDPKIAKSLRQFAPFKSEINTSYETGHIDGDWYDKNTERKVITFSYINEGVVFLKNKFKHWFCYPLAQKLKNQDYKNIWSIMEYLFSSNSEYNPFDKDKNKFNFIYDFKFWNADSKEREAIFYCFFLNSRHIWFDIFADFYKYLNNKNIKFFKEQLNKKLLTDFTFAPEKIYSFQVNSQNIQNKPELLPKPHKNLYQQFIYPDAHNFSEPERNFVLNFLESKFHQNKIDWWYRNIALESDAWKILYLTEMEEIRTFYPDFIVKIEGKIWIIENKDTSDRDQNNPFKFKYLKHFCNFHKLNFAFVILDKNKKMKFNNTEWDKTYTGKHWKSLNNDFFV